MCDLPVNKIQLTKKQVQILLDCLQTELGYMIPVQATTEELKTLHQILASLKVEDEQLCPKIHPE